MATYDYLVIGCGMFGSVFAQQMADRGKKVLVIEKRGHMGGNCYTENVEGINVHMYGPHIFHTSNSKVWKYINQFAEFNNYVNRPKVIYKDKIYSFPINLLTLHQLWGVKTPQQAIAKLREEAVPNKTPSNLEEWVLAQVGKDIYRIFIRGYTKKQWGRSPKNLPIGIIKRLPIRLNFNDNYFSDKYQGIPIGGYTKMFENMLSKVEVKLNADYFSNRDYWNSIATVIFYTGKIDEFFDYRFGRLQYRSLRFETKLLQGDFQGNAVMNYTEESVPYTRTIEHKYFEFIDSNETIVTYEFPEDYDESKTPYYPINDDWNNQIYSLYKQEATKHKNVMFGGRLGTYSYMDMDDVIAQALETAAKLSKYK